MHILIATDAWHPQMSGGVRTLRSCARAFEGLGVNVSFLTPQDFPTVPLPGYPDIRLAIASPWKIARRIRELRPDAIHVTTEGPLCFAVRRHCVACGLPFTTSFTTRFPEYIAARLPIPESLSYAVLRRFHSAARVTMAATPYLIADLERRGFKNLGMWTRGVDTELFRPDRPVDLGLSHPLFAPLGR